MPYIFNPFTGNFDFYKSSSGSVGTLHYEAPITGTLGTDMVYTFAHNIGELILNNATQDPTQDYTGQNTTTATFPSIPTGSSLLNYYIG